MLSYSITAAEIMHLKTQDHILASLINNMGEIHIQLETDYFSALVSSIVGQQLSAKAAQTIFNRLLGICNELTADTIKHAEYEQLLACGLSKAKVSYLKNLAQSVLDTELTLSNLETLNDEEIISQLTKVKGIGRWTAEMFLIFSMGRKDVYSQGDAGLRRAMKWLYGELDEPATRLITEKWRPYRSTASLYLWEAINKGYLEV